ncbi:MAG: hypothetical protein M3384_13945, partial [Acidobacteriota bacterium]|nr:hypothetical protein [Acidobacteriota bacterium]
QIRIDARPDSLRVETDYGSWRRSDGNGVKNRNHGRLEVQYRLQVPRGAVLDGIETVNGSVTISNMTNSTRASAVNGSVKATNLRGTARISTVNGTTEADFDTLAGSGQITLDTVNGKVLLTIPSDANATLRADTVNGQIYNDFGLPVRKGEYVGRDLYGRLGSGALNIKLNSVNGELAIRRKQDGKTPSPATNLLPQKNKADDPDTDEDAEDDDNEVSVNAAKINKDAAKAVKDAQKESLKAMKLTEKELAKIQPELDRINEEAIRDAAKIVNSEEMKERLREARQRQREAIMRARDIGWVAPTIEKKTETFKVRSVPRVTVEAKDCSVTVKGWDKPEVQYLITTVSKVQQPVNYKIDRDDSQVNIKISEQTTPATDGVVFGDLSRIRVEVFVPKKSNLRILAEREIRLENVSGEIELQGDDEAVSIRDVEGRLRVTTGDGNNRVIGFKGELESRTGDGAINLEGDFQKIDAHTIDGTIVLTLPETVNANIESNRKELGTEGVRLVSLGDKKDVSVWKVGNGGSLYRLYAADDGQVFIRTANNLKASF